MRRLDNFGDMDPESHPSSAEAPRALRIRAPLLLATMFLLVLSEVLWLWHSWPVREALDTEQITSGASI